MIKHPRAFFPSALAHFWRSHPSVFGKSPIDDSLIADPRTEEQRSQSYQKCIDGVLLSSSIPSPLENVRPRRHVATTFSFSLLMVVSDVLTSRKENLRTRVGDRA